MQRLPFCLLLVWMFAFASLRSSAQSMPAEPRLRGAMIPTFATVADLRDLAALGANSVRWQLMWGGFPSYRASNEPLSSYAAWMDATLQHLDTMLPHCRALGLRIVLDVHTPPGGHAPDGKWRLFQHREHQEFFVNLWRDIATRYRGDTTFWAFDLMNEPNEDGRATDSARSWREVAEETARAIRAVDPTRRLVVEAAPNGNSRALAAFSPLPLSNIAYSFHMYDPVNFTHQRIGEGDTTVLPYPGEFYGSRWGRRRLRQWHRPVREWQLRYDVPIYVGEFSAVRWAPGAYRYLQDCIRIYERYGWHWAYHAWRESHVWSIEHSSDRADETPVPGGSNRLALLQKYFRKSR